MNEGSDIVTRVESTPKKESEITGGGTYTTTQGGAREKGKVRDQKE